ncbi:MAG TPA: glutathione S-transferase N-terminal domain-containing protein [Caulobacteraceae bacterium]|nr:glutathione S-transferase N-terminal domain-containing protein [Caulobacteraceae bacterium]
MITLYTSPTPNGFRASIMLEETGLPYQVRAVDLKAGEHKTPDFLAVNATGKIPAIVDDEADTGVPFALAETLAIAVYLAEKSGRILPASATERAMAMQWGATVISGFGAATAGIYFARLLDEAAHAKIIAKFYADIDIFLAAMEERLRASPYLAGSDFSFADALAIPTIVLSMKTFGVDLSRFKAVERWRDEVMLRPAVAKGFAVP